MLRHLSWTLCLGLFLGSSAHADYLTFAFLSNTISGSGAVNVLANGDGSYTATSGTLQVTGDPRASMASLVFNPNGTQPTRIPGSPDGTYVYDNQIFPTSTQLIDFSGILFSTGNSRINLYNSGSTTNPIYTYINYDVGTRLQLTVNNLRLFFGSVQPGIAPVAPSSTPEPSSLALVGIAGLGGFGVRCIRRRRHAA